jgi:hypothetical protein
MPTAIPESNKVDMGTLDPTREIEYTTNTDIIQPMNAKMDIAPVPKLAMPNPKTIANAAPKAAPWDALIV